MKREEKIERLASTLATAVRKVFSAAILAALLAGVSQAQAPPNARLEITQPVKLLDCEPASNVPCFRVGFRAVNADGSPALIPVLSPAQLAASLTIDFGPSAVKPFYAGFLGGTSHSRSARLALFLVDTSGSMNDRLPDGETRFEAAKAAILHYLAGFTDGVDRVAVVGFESHRVAATIRAAQFATTRTDAQSEVAALAPPEPRNNTALYSAMDIGLDVIEAQVKATSGTPQASLYLLTDGDNDVQPSRGDDSDLLRGAAGLQIVAQKVQNDSGIDVVAIGIGNPQAINQDALSQISDKFQMITDAGQLMQALPHPASTVPANPMVAAFLSPWPDRASLAARTIPVRLRLKLPGGRELDSQATFWTAPEIGPAVFAGNSDAREGEALLASKLSLSSSAWMAVLRPALVFAILGAVLLVLWFWVPRLIWADQDADLIPQAERARWGGETGTRAARRQVPPGFAQGQGVARAAPRAPSDATIQAPSGLMGTRTRLEVNPSSDRDRRK